MEYNVHLLPNGIRLLLVPSNSAISHACILVKAGSRNESPEQSGIAHFIEHLLFKKTEKRNTNQILNRLESVGADLNAYTTKEYTCIHASFLNPYLGRTLELFHDVMFHSVFPEDEIEKEKNIILDEIASYQDQPEEAVYDDFEDLLFAGHPLGHNILGTADSVAKIDRAAILNFIHEHYDTREIVVAVLGNYTPTGFQKTAGKYFERIPANKAIAQNFLVPIQTVVNLSLEKPIAQAHHVLGIQAYSMHHPYKTALLLLNNMIGGNGMSSILNLQVREKHGIAYTIESGYSPLSDCGLFTVYFGTDKDNIEPALKLIYKEFRKLREQPLTPLQLQKAQNKFIGQIALGEENRIGLIISMAKSLMDYNTIDSLAEIFAKIQHVTSNEIQQVANDLLDEKKLSSLSFIPA